MAPSLSGATLLSILEGVPVCNLGTRVAAVVPQLASGTDTT